MSVFVVSSSDDWTRVPPEEPDEEPVQPIDPTEAKVIDLNWDLMYTEGKIRNEERWNEFAYVRYEVRMAEWQSRCHTRAEMRVPGPKIEQGKTDGEVSDTKLLDLNNKARNLRWDIWLLENGFVPK
jgi:hypothetical protein